MSTKRRLAAAKRAASLENNEQNNSGSVFCRTCLTTDNLVSIFYNHSDEEKMSHNWKLVTGLEIKMNDGLSQKICTKCLDIFNLTLQFRRKCRRAEKALLGMINGNLTKSLKKYSTVDRDVKPKIKKTKVEQEDYEYDNDNIVPYADDFQNDEEFDSKDDVKPIYVMKEQKPPVIHRSGRRQKPLKIPNASSYKCGTCGKEFRMKSTYKAHLRFHTNYCVCEACGKRCRNNNQLQEHKRARHGLGRIHKCAYCEYSSATKEALVIHERRHTGERPYICDHCGATFHRRSNLVQHIAIHLPEKNFQCDMCPKKLKSRKFLQIHKHNAHTGRRYGYLCPVCARRFEKPNKVRAHTKRVHGLGEGEHGPIQRVQLFPSDPFDCAKWISIVAKERGEEFYTPCKNSKVCSIHFDALDITGNTQRRRLLKSAIPKSQCTFCPTREKSKKRLQIHISKTHRLRRYSYKCPRCLKLFQRSEHAHRHLARVHRVPRPDHPPVERVLREGGAAGEGGGWA